MSFVKDAEVKVYKKVSRAEDGSESLERFSVDDLDNDSREVEGDDENDDSRIPRAE